MTLKEFLWPQTRLLSIEMHRLLGRINSLEQRAYDAAITQGATPNNEGHHQFQTTLHHARRMSSGYLGLLDIMYFSALGTTALNLAQYAQGESFGAPEGITAACAVLMMLLRDEIREKVFKQGEALYVKSDKRAQEDPVQFLADTYSRKDAL